MLTKQQGGLLKRTQPHVVYDIDMVHWIKQETVTS